MGMLSSFRQGMSNAWSNGFFGIGGRAYEGAEQGTARTARWNAPQGLSPDAQLRDRDRLNARGGDAIRNDPLGAGYLSHRVESTIGTGLKLQPKPDYTALGQTPQWALDFRKQVKSHFKQFFHDPDCWIDIRRQLNGNRIIRQLYTSYVFHAEYIIVFEWRKKVDRRPGRAYARTAVNVVHPELLCNPDGTPDGKLPNGNTLRSGIEFDADGAPVAYHFRQGHEFDTTSDSVDRFTWKRVERTVPGTPGRLQVLHVYEPEHPGQTRGRPTFAAALLGLRSLKKFNEAALSAQILQSMYAAAITSQTDPTSVGQLMGRGEGSYLDNYIELQAQHHSNGVTFNGAKALSLVPGEDFKIITPGNVAPNLDAFNVKTIEHLAAALPGVSYEEISKDYKNTNYSSSQASSQAPFRFVMGQREHIVDPGASAIYTCLFEELVNDGRLALPADAPGFYEAKTAWTYCEWIGNPRGHNDPVKAQEANKLRRQLGTLTFAQNCADEGQDGDEQLDELALEDAALAAARLPRPMDLLTKTDTAVEAAAAEAQKKAEASAN